MKGSYSANLAVLATLTFPKLFCVALPRASPRSSWASRAPCSEAAHPPSSFSGRIETDHPPSGPAAPASRPRTNGCNLAKGPIDVWPRVAGLEVRVALSIPIERVRVPVRVGGRRMVVGGCGAGPLCGMPAPLNTFWDNPWHPDPFQHDPRPRLRDRIVGETHDLDAPAKLMYFDPGGQSHT